jgi:hypothetical protein
MCKARIKVSGICIKMRIIQYTLTNRRECCYSTKGKKKRNDSSQPRVFPDPGNTGNNEIPVKPPGDTPFI